MYRQFKGFKLVVLRRIIISCGVLLFTLNLLGFIIEPKFSNYKEGNGKGIAGYNYSNQEPEALLELLAGKSNNFSLPLINELIFQTIRHSDERRITILENWLLWIGGHFYEPLSWTQNAERIIKGRAALCGEVVILLNTIAEKNGLKARIITFPHHVVSEIETDKGWIVADPDYGVTFPWGLPTTEDRKNLEKALQEKGYDDEKIKNYITLFQTANNKNINQYTTALNPRLKEVEKIADYLKWIIPLLLLIIGFFWKKMSTSPR